MKKLIELFYPGPILGISGIELMGTSNITDENILRLKKVVEEEGLEVCMITPDIWATARWGRGSITSSKEKIRKEALGEIKKAMDWAVEMNCDAINVWLGQDWFSASALLREVL